MILVFGCIAIAGVLVIWWWMEQGIKNTEREFDERIRELERRIEEQEEDDL